MHIIREGPILNDKHRNTLNLYFSSNEIKAAMWSILEEKALGLDGYNSGFFKAAWEEVGEDIVQAIQNFFNTGALLNAWNVTAITLIPKSACPNDPSDFRPISCCHVIYKCISKLLCNRMILVLNDIINSLQLLLQDVAFYTTSSYIKTRKKIMNGRIASLAASWIDLRKAYDMMD